MSSTHQIVVLGGNISGLAVSHYILRHIIPASKKTTGTRYKLVLVSPNTHYQHKIGAPRALSQRELVDKAFMPFADAFSGYGSLFEHVQGQAVALEPLSKLITVSSAKDGSSTQLRYDSLVIATGKRSASPLWSLHGAHTISADTLRDTNLAIGKAKTIVVAGGGATGVETAGEIAGHWTGKQVTLLSGGKGLLSHLKDAAIGKKAEALLRKLNVATKHNVRVVSSEKTANGKTTLTLSNGTTREVDVFVDATGGRPNSGFLPSGWLDAQGKVKTNVATLRIAAAQHVYAIGDVASYSQSSIMDIHRAIAPLGYSLWEDLTAGAKVTQPLKKKLYKQDQGDFQLVPVGPGGGVGTGFGMSFPSFVVKFAKSKTFFFDKVPGNVAGAAYTKIDVPAMP